MAYLATITVHWPTGPVNCCEAHGEKLVALAEILGYHVGVTDALGNAECLNCRNETSRENVVPSDQDDAAHDQSGE